MIPPFPPLIILGLALLMGGCASNVPPLIRNAPPANPTLGAVVAQPAAHQAEPLRWGGRIVAVNNFRQGSELVVLALPLNNWGEPLGDGAGQGRFIARSDEFIDPAEYAPDSKVTIYGELEGMEERSIGEFPYSYPLVRIHHRYLWPKASDQPRSAWNWAPHDRWMYRDPVIIIRQPSPK